MGVLRGATPRPAAPPAKRDTAAHAHLWLLAAACVALLLGVAGVALCRRRRMRRPSHPTVPKIAKPVDPIVYNYVCPQPPVEFVVPATVAPPSPVEPDSVESGGALCRRLSLMEAAGPTFLGGLNPALYQEEDVRKEDGDGDYPEGHCGRLWFGVELHAATERLVVRLARVRNLPSRVYGAHNCCDPFVRVCLLPDARRPFQSRPKKRTCAPDFDETFIFQVSAGAVEGRTLRLSVFDNEGGRRHTPLGKVEMPLPAALAAAPHGRLQWRDLDRSEGDGEGSGGGELLVSLCFNPHLERLTVTVCETRGLRAGGGSSSVCRVSLSVGRRRKTKKTRPSPTGQYNESFHFRMPQGEMAHASLNIALTDHKRKDECWGRLVLGPYMYSRGPGRLHWEEAVAAPAKQIRRWHKLT